MNNGRVNLIVGILTLVGVLISTVTTTCTSRKINKVNAELTRQGFEMERSKNEEDRRIAQIQTLRTFIPLLTEDKMEQRYYAVVAIYEIVDEALIFKLGLDSITLNNAVEKIGKSDIEDRVLNKTIDSKVLREVQKVLDLNDVTTIIATNQKDGEVDWSRFADSKIYIKIKSTKRISKDQVNIDWGDGKSQFDKMSESKVGSFYEYSIEHDYARIGDFEVSINILGFGTEIKEFKRITVIHL